MISVTGPLKMWSSDEGRMHFMSVPAALSSEIKAHGLIIRRGFGSVRVQVTLDDVTWRASVFPVKSTGGYFLPMKTDVCRKTGIAEGDDVTVELELL